MSIRSFFILCVSPMLTVTLAVAQPAGTARSPNPVLIDANGTVIGAPISQDVYGELGLVLMTANDGRAVAIGVQRSGFGQGDEVYYLTSGCTGTPYVKPQIGFFASAAIAHPGRTVYIADLTATAQVINSFSVFQQGQGCQSVTASNQLVPAVPTGIRLNRFTPPFNTVMR